MVDNQISLQEMIDDVNNGREIEFKFNGRMYSITHYNAGISAIEFDKLDTEKTYQSAEELFNDYKLDGDVTLNDVFQQIEIELYA